MLNIDIEYLGNNIKVYNMDCMDMLNTLADNSVDLIVTSPPYNKGATSVSKKTGSPSNKWVTNIVYNAYNDNMEQEKYNQWMIAFINLCIQKLKPTGSLMFNHKPIRKNNSVILPLSFILQSNAKIYQEIIWHRLSDLNVCNRFLIPSTERIYWIIKDSPKVFRDNLSKQYIQEVWQIPPKPNKDHPAPFPIELVTNCIKLTTEPNDLVVDPFCGSGTSAIASLMTQRNFIGSEIDKTYVELSEKNILDYTSQIRIEDTAFADEKVSQCELRI